LIRIECDLAEANEPGSLLDFSLDGLITRERSKDSVQGPSDFVLTLLRDAAGSHLIESIIVYCGEEVFNLIWDVYLKSDLPKLALHPNGNFILARVVYRLDEARFSYLLGQLRDVWAKTINSGRTGVLLATVERSYSFPTQQSQVMDVSERAFKTLVALTPPFRLYVQLIIMKNTPLEA
jgi:nucleolar protein 9